jgi:outer membrane protein
MTHLLVCFIAALAAGPAYGQTPSLAAPPPATSLALADVTQLALERNLRICAAWQGAETAAHVVDQVEALGKGKVGIEAEVMHLNAPVSIVATFDLPFGISITLPPMEVAPQDLVHARLQAGYPVYTGQKIQRAMEQATCGAEALKCVARDTEAAVMLEVSEYYLGALLAREALDVQQQALETYRAHLAQAEKVFRAGVVARYDVIRAETAVKEQEKRVTDARNQLDLAVAALRTALEMDPATPLALAGQLRDVTEGLTLAEARKVSASDSAILEALDFKAQAYHAAGRVEEAGKRPQVTAVGQWEMLTGNMAQTDPEWSVGVQATLELYDGGARRAKVAEARSQKTQTLTQREDAEGQIKLAIQSAYLDMDAARAGYGATQKAAELAAESLRLAQRRFEFGVGTSLEVLDATTALAGAQVGQRQTLYQLDKAWLRLHRYLGDMSSACKRSGL